MYKKSLLLVFLLAVMLISIANAEVPKKKSVNELQQDFRKLQFGMFLHYNMATYKNAQWVVGYPSPAEFNPGGKVDTDAWADAAVSAGMKYGVLTVKHVAGFCLWDSKYTTYDVMHPDCPYKQDLVAQFVKSFKSRGLKAGLYYCWRHPGFDTGNNGKNNGKFKVLPPECDPATHDLKAQIEFQKKQIAELIEKYPDVFYIWNDALDDKVMTGEEAKDFFSTTRQVITSSNWWSWAKKGTPFMDIAVKETRHFPETNTAPGETCWKMEQGWFWNEGCSTGNVNGIMSHMDKAYGRNSNFLLNVGPDKNGKIIDSSVKALAEIGKLLGTNTKKQIPAQLPDPDSKAPDTTKPLKVFILMGQSNMVGFGMIGPDTKKGTLEYLTKKENKYPHLLDNAGNWTVRNDVWCVQVTAGSRKDWLQPGFGAKAQFIGPELGFGHVMGYVHDEQVLIIKATMGNRALGWDLTSPSSRTAPGKEKHPDQWYQGWQYDVFIKDTHKVLNNLKKYFPAYKDQGYEIAGFCWWQGHKDQGTPKHVLAPPYNLNWTTSYEKNLVNLINDLRKEFKAPKAPFTLATIAFDGEKLKGPGLSIANAQLAVSGEKGKYPEFKDNVKTIEARGFWRDGSVSPTGAGYHYNHNAGTYMDVGDALGRSMAELLEKPKK
ncbi:MAG: alpha-L-fucosidase [Phycisphaerae bacterium]|nr:alpha-L-fucosidase [Phycisphaerae bacterium]